MINFNIVFEVGFLMGILGSVHCIGMCGPLMMALPIAHKSFFQKIIALFLYYFGKIISYSMLGILFGLFGLSLPIFNIQRHFSIIIGLTMLIYVVYVFILKQKQIKLGIFSTFNNNLISLLGKLFASKSRVAFLWIGILNGFLPCGMIYLALSAALATQSILQGGLLMAFFGLGTIPALLTLAIGGQFMGVAFRKQIQKILPVFIFSMGILLILRGLNLGIPYISPHAGVGAEVISCHN